MNILIQHLCKINLFLFFLSTVTLSQYNDTTVYVNQNINHFNINSIVCRMIVNGKDIFNVSDWESRFLNSGYSVLSRNLLNIILDEQKLSLSDLTNDTEIGHLLNSDAIFIHTFISDTGGFFDYYSSNYKLISTLSGEIIFNADYSFLDFKWSDFYESRAKFKRSTKYKNSLIPNYKSQIRNHNSAIEK